MKITVLFGKDTTGQFKHSAFELATIDRQSLIFTTRKSRVANYCPRLTQKLPKIASNEVVCFKHA